MIVKYKLQYFLGLGLEGRKILQDENTKKSDRKRALPSERHVAPARGPTEQKLGNKPRPQRPAMLHRLPKTNFSFSGMVSLLAARIEPYGLVSGANFAWQAIAFRRAA